MPARNVIKTYAPETYYHVYNRGVSKQAIFLDEQDYSVFLGFLKRYLSAIPERDGNRQLYQKLNQDVELLAYCLMPNHFHLFLYEKSGIGMIQLLKRVSVSYGMYFNKKYKRTGSVFQQRYRAVRISDDGQLMHISRYIHMNPKDYKRWPYSSLKYYIDTASCDWIHFKRLPVIKDYADFLEEYESRRLELRELADDLAG